MDDTATQFEAIVMDAIHRYNHITFLADKLVTLHGRFYGHDKAYNAISRDRTDLFGQSSASRPSSIKWSQPP
jgi:hypothetical protein